MSADRIALPRIVPRDVDVLERRALALASGDAEGAEATGAARFVLFRIRGLPCALEAAPVARAVSRLLGATPVPTLAGAERTIAFVEEQPLPVADLAGIAAGGERPANELAGGPALVLSTAAGPVAVAVEGPLDLAEDRLAGTAREPSEDATAGLRLAGRLADGTSVLDAAWLLAWAEKAARP